MKILLAEPEFPIASKSKNHHAFLPIGLLKIASYHRSKLGDKVALNRGNHPAPFRPDQIKITSLFTYWAKYVWDSVRYYQTLYPKAHIQVGGIYASLLPKHCAQSGCDEVVKGLYKNGAAEEYEPAYDLVDVDYQIIHASRGCFRKCNFCGVWKIEPNITFKESLKDEIHRPKVIFYDNNLLANPNIEQILEEISEIRLEGNRRVHCESQSGFDGRLLTPQIAGLLRKAKFKNPRIAWDSPYSRWPKIKEQIATLCRAGYKPINIYVFMLYNHQIPYSEMRQKLDACRRWGVRVIDCRYRPLDSKDDGYNPRVKHQSAENYHIHPKWNDHQVRGFRRAVRRQNIALILGLPNGRYIEGVEKRYIPTG